ncbi:MAG: type II toxin-antitoxin system RelE/ParE family toxin [Anaerolineaceae bacterium]|nr:type II toxin-antitoxin system RelE/ParE family toxin [Anaerolineaceae bacterium]
MAIELLRSGEALKLYALVVNGKCLIRDFINGLEIRSKKQVFKLIEQMADRLVLFDEQKFRAIGDNIFELKTRGGIRILCFWGGSKTLILTHGFSKPTKKVLQIEKAKAIKWLKEYQDKHRL